jgi:hypothetical protein
MDRTEWNNHPDKLLLDAIHNAMRVARSVENRVLLIAEKLDDVGMERLATECEDAVRGLTDAVRHVSDSHGTKVNADLRESQIGVGNILSAILNGNLGPAGRKPA